MASLYNTPPSDDIFEDVKRNAISIWQDYPGYDHLDEAHGYSRKMVDRIKNLGNISDNFMYIVVMFDFTDQGKLVRKVRPETANAIRDRFIDNGDKPHELGYMGLEKPMIVS